MTPRRARWIAALTAIFVGLVLAHRALLATPAGRWIASFTGLGVRWEDPYQALGSVEGLGSLGADGERLRLANAIAEGEPPSGLDLRRRIHAPGTLARLRYETFDTSGRRLDQWEVRAVVPPLPWLEEPRDPAFPLDGGCPAECQAAKERGAFILDRSGESGLAAEWVLRMPVGRTFSLGPQPLDMQDVLDTAPYQLGIRSRSIEGRTVREPADVRVTLVEACEGQLRMGTASYMEFAPFAIVPVPTGLKTSQWVQLTGCGRPDPVPHPAPRPPPSAAEASAAAPQDSPAAPASPAPPGSPAPPPQPHGASRIAPPRPQVHAVVVKRARRTGIASLEVDQKWFDAHPEAVEFALHHLCRFDPAEGTWTNLPRPDHGWAWTIPARSEANARTGFQPLVTLPAEPGLYWAQWIERPDGARSLGAEDVREALLVSGPVRCNGIGLASPPAGQVAACVPSRDRAVARFVPAPREACAR